MNLEVLGNLGDFVGGIAVVLTLIYLAVQIRENTKEVRNNTVQALLDRSTGLFGETISSDIPDIQEKELTGRRPLLAAVGRSRLKAGGRNGKHCRQNYFPDRMST